MNKTVIISVLLYLLSCGGTPNIEFEKVRHDFGYVKQEITVKHVFNFKNSGDGTLVIQGVRAG